jgi:prefoldin subunit 5
LLKKIEELTLYTLGQEEEISSLRTRLPRMENLQKELTEIRATLSDLVSAR